MGRLRHGLGTSAVVLLTALSLSSCGLGEPEGPALGAAGETGAAAAGWAHHFDVQRIVSGLHRPTYVGAAPGDTQALWVLEQAGRVVRLEGGGLMVALDITNLVSTGTEAGLLGVAFHPQFATNRRLFLHWTDMQGDTRIAEFRAKPDGRSIDPRPIRELLWVDQPEENHKGGQLAFGPDGRLYLGLGDGGGAFDPRRHAQDPSQLLGKVVATDVDAEVPNWEVIIMGLRNPWRFWFDPALGEIWVADVGQDKAEEVNRVRLELDEPPKKLGWSAYEGNHKLAGYKLDRRSELVKPVHTYSHEEGCAVIGGFMYGGTQFPELVRRYVFGDFCSGSLWSLKGTPDMGATDLRRERAKVPMLAHIGEDADGEIVFASASGSLYRPVPPSPGAN